VSADKLVGWMGEGCRAGRQKGRQAGAVSGHVVSGSRPSEQFQGRYGHRDGLVGSCTSTHTLQ
jgi:hypothetical protein